MTKQKSRWVACGTLGVLAATTFGALGTPVAQAGSTGRRNTTIGLGAVTAYGLLRHKRSLAIAGGVGTVIAYSRYRKAKKAEERQRQARLLSRRRTSRYSSYTRRRRRSYSLR